jgi:hypothetical protein
MNGTPGNQQLPFARSANQRIGTKKKLTQKRLKELLDYDPETGEFIRKTRRYKYQIGEKAGTLNPRGYLVIGVDGKRYMAHRLAFLWMEGYFPEHDVDHIDRNRANNRWLNLRESSRSCNMMNCNVHCDSTSLVTGVGLNNRKNRWVARICILGKTFNLGTFKNKQEAVVARWHAEIKSNFSNCNSKSSAYEYLKKIKHPALQGLDENLGWTQKKESA